MGTDHKRRTSVLTDPIHHCNTYSALFPSNLIPKTHVQIYIEGLTSWLFVASTMDRRALLRAYKYQVRFFFHILSYCSFRTTTKIVSPRVRRFFVDTQLQEILTGALGPKCGSFTRRYHINIPGTDQNNPRRIQKIKKRVGRTQKTRMLHMHPGYLYAVRSYVPREFSHSVEKQTKAWQHPEA